MKMYLLTRSDGYSIESVMQTLNQDEAKDLLRKEYAAHTPSEWMEEYKELSSCNDMNAVLYSNGEDVYVWQIIEAMVPVAQSEELNTMSIPAAPTRETNCIVTSGWNCCRGYHLSSGRHRRRIDRRRN